MMSLKNMLSATDAANGATYNKKVVTKAATQVIVPTVVDTVLNGVVETTNNA